MTLARRLSVYNLVGLGGFVLQLTVIFVLTRFADWHYALATIVGLQAAIVHNFVGDCRWTWADRPAKSARDLLRRAAKYQIARGAALVANVALTAVFAANLSVEPEIANVMAVVCCSLINFTFADRIVFGDVS